MAEIDQNVRYEGGPSVLVLADDPGRRAATATLVARLGGRAVAPDTVKRGPARIDALAGGGPVVVELADDGGAPVEALLDRLNEEAAAGRRTGIVNLPASLIDVAMARAPHPNVILLADADETQRDLVIGAALAPAATDAPLLREETTAPLQLLQLSEEVGRIARTLAALSGADARRGGGRPAPLNGEARPPSAATVRALIRARRLREQFFPATLFADPAWDMILDLYAARLEGRAVAVSSLCIAAAVPPTTALRWMKQLVDDELFVRIADPRDGRRVFIELAASAADALAGYFEAIGRVGFALP